MNGSTKLEEFKVNVELVLWLIKNLLRVPDTSSEHESIKTRFHNKIHEPFLKILKEDCVFDVFLCLISLRYSSYSIGNHFFDGVYNQGQTGKLESCFVRHIFQHIQRISFGQNKSS